MLLVLSGTIKSKFLEFLIRKDITKRNGFRGIDPHGDLIKDIKSYLALVLPKEELARILKALYRGLRLQPL